MDRVSGESMAEDKVAGMEEQSCRLRDWHEATFAAKPVFFSDGVRFAVNKWKNISTKGRIAGGTLPPKKKIALPLGVSEPPRFLGSKVHSTSGVSIGSAVLAQFMVILIKCHQNNQKVIYF